MKQLLQPFNLSKLGVSWVGGENESIFSYIGQMMHVYGLLTDMTQLYEQNSNDLTVFSLEYFSKISYIPEFCPPSHCSVF